MIPAPNPLHQQLVHQIDGQLYNYLRGKPCKAFPAPFDVRLPRKSKDDKDILTVVQPDLCIICDASKLDNKGCIGAPDIVIEILSPGNNRKELKNKYEAYEEAGVKEYWLIHPGEQTFLKYTATDEKFQSSRPLTTGDIVATPVLPGFALDLTELFETT